MTDTYVPTGSASATESRGERPEKIWGLMAEFDSPAAIFHAAQRARAEGYRWFDCHTPFPMHGLDRAMGIKPTILPVLVFFGGATGVVLGVLLQWFANATSFDFWLIVPVRGYDFLVSGKPLASVPDWIPVVFEMTILLAALACVGWMLLLNGLPWLHHPTLKSPRFARATDDRFFLVIEARDPKFVRRQTEAFLQTLGPLSIEALEP
jgi:hypothetical protein